MKYQCPLCHGSFTTPMPVRSAQCPYCNATVDLSDYPIPQNVGIFDNGPSGKSRGIAGLLALLAGGLGAHFFYLGKIKSALICLAVTFLLCGLGGVWHILTIIQGVKMLTMSQEEFEEKFVYSTALFPL